MFYELFDVVVSQLKPNSIALSVSPSHELVTSCEPDTLDSSNPSATGRKPGLRPGELVADLLASWITPDRPNSITPSSSLAGRRLAREPARKLEWNLAFK